MRTVHRLTTALALLALLAVSVGHAQDGKRDKTEAKPGAHTLAWKWVKGVVTRVEYVEVSDSKTETMGRKSTGNSRKTTVYREEVLEVEKDGTAKIGLTYKRYALKKKDVRVEQDFDTDRAEDREDQTDPALAGYVKMIDHTLTLTIKPNGEITKLEGGKELLDKMMEAHKDDPMREVIRGSLEAAFGGDTLRNALSMVYRVLPDKSVNTGDKWSVKASMPMLGAGNLVVANEFSLVSVAKGDGGTIASIQRGGSYTFEKAEQGEEGALAGMHIENTDSKCSGTVEFNVTTGQTTKWEMTQSYTMSLKMGAVNAVSKVESTFTNKREPWKEPNKGK